MVRDGPPLSGGGEGGYDDVNGCHSVGMANSLTMAIACTASCGVECVLSPATNNGMVQDLGAGEECRWHGGRSPEDWPQGIAAQRATHWALASKESKSSATAGNFRQRIPAVRIHQTERPRNKVEMPVAGKQRQTMLPRQRCDP